MQCACVVCSVSLDGDRTAALAAGWLSTVDSALPHAHLRVSDFLVSREIADPGCGDGLLCDICTSLVIHCDATYGKYLDDLRAVKQRRVRISTETLQTASVTPESRQPVLVAKALIDVEEVKPLSELREESAAGASRVVSEVEGAKQASPGPREEKIVGRQTRSSTKRLRAAVVKEENEAPKPRAAKRKGRVKSATKKRVGRSAPKRAKSENDEEVENSVPENENEEVPVGGQKEPVKLEEIEESTEPPMWLENEEEEGDENLAEQSDIEFVPEDEDPSKKSAKSKVFRGKWYKCTECNFQAKWRVNLNFHVKRHHQNVSPFVCKTCGEGFASTIAKSTHMQKVHERKAKYACDHCDKSFYSKNGLNYHLRSIQAGDEQERLMCNICGDQVPSYQLASHMHRLHRKKKLVVDYHCEFCPEVTYKHKISIIRHMASVHGIGHAKPKPEHQGYICPDCGKKIRTREYYIAHRFQDHNVTMPGLKEYNCSFCGKKWYVKRAYEAHIAMHTGERTFKCKFCNYSSNHSGNICVHMRRVHPAEYNLIKKQPKDANEKLAAAAAAPPPSSSPSPSPPPAPSVKVPPPAYVAPPPPPPPPPRSPCLTVATSQQPTTLHSQIVIAQAPPAMVSQPLAGLDSTQVVHFVPALVPLDVKVFEIPLRDGGPTIVATRVIDTGELHSKPIRAEPVEAKLIVTHVTEPTVEPH